METSQRSDPLVGAVLDGRYRVDGDDRDGRHVHGVPRSRRPTGPAGGAEGDGFALRAGPTVPDPLPARGARRRATEGSRPGLGLRPGLRRSCTRSSSWNSSRAARCANSCTSAVRCRPTPSPPSWRRCSAVSRWLTAPGLVHRDVKPENVLISDDGDVKIADFGLVRAVAEAKITSTSVILGTAAYLSPEQVSTGDAGPRSDVYGVGVLAYELLTGDTPFKGDNALSVAYQRMDNDVPPPSAAIAGVPTQFDDLVAVRDGARPRRPVRRRAGNGRRTGGHRRGARACRRSGCPRRATRPSTRVGRGSARSSRTPERTTETTAQAAAPTHPPTRAHRRHWSRLPTRSGSVRRHRDRRVRVGPAARQAGDAVLGDRRS